jgi:hypothetical protein
MKIDIRRLDEIIYARAAMSFGNPVIQNVPYRT